MRDFCRKQLLVTLQITAPVQTTHQMTATWTTTPSLTPDTAMSDVAMPLFVVTAKSTRQFISAVSQSLYNSLSVSWSCSESNNLLCLDNNGNHGTDLQKQQWQS